jgi:hypothetical protein
MGKTGWRESEPFSKNNGAGMRILGVNGIHNFSWSKDSFTDRMLDALSHDHEVVDVRYSRMLAMLVYSDYATNRRVRKILDQNQPGDVLIAHSFGCLASVGAMKQGARFKVAFFFGAACEPDIEIPDSFEVLYNIHSEADRTLKLGDLLPFHDFGLMGCNGYKGNNPKVVNICADGNSHNSYTDAKNLCRWRDFIEERI